MDNSENKNVEDLKNIEILELLWKALNKANSNGVFTIDEAFSLKILYEKLKKNI